MDWEAPAVRRIMTAVVPWIGVGAVVSSFLYNAWLFRVRPRVPVPAEGFTQYLGLSGDLGSYVRPWEAQLFFGLLIGGALFGAIAGLAIRAIYGPFDEVVSPYFRKIMIAVVFGLAAAQFLISNV